MNTKDFLLLAIVACALAQSEDEIPLENDNQFPPDENHLEPDGNINQENSFRYIDEPVEITSTTYSNNEIPLTSADISTSSVFEDTQFITTTEASPTTTLNDFQFSTVTEPTFTFVLDEVQSSTSDYSATIPVEEIQTTSSTETSTTNYDNIQSSLSQENPTTLIDDVNLSTTTEYIITSTFEDVQELANPIDNSNTTVYMPAPSNLELFNNKNDNASVNLLPEKITTLPEASIQQKSLEEPIQIPVEVQNINWSSVDINSVGANTVIPNDVQLPFSIENRSILTVADTNSSNGSIDLPEAVQLPSKPENTSGPSLQDQLITSTENTSVPLIEGVQIPISIENSSVLLVEDEQHTSTENSSITLVDGEQLGVSTDNTSSTFLVENAQAPNNNSITLVEETKLNSTKSLPDLKKSQLPVTSGDDDLLNIFAISTMLLSSNDDTDSSSPNIDNPNKGNASETLGENIKQDSNLTESSSATEISFRSAVNKAPEGTSPVNTLIEAPKQVVNPQESDIAIGAATTGNNNGGVSKSVIGLIVAGMVLIVAVITIKKNWSSIKNRFSSNPRASNERGDTTANGTSPEEVPLKEKSPV